MYKRENYIEWIIEKIIENEREKEKIDKEGDTLLLTNLKSITNL